MVLRAVYSDAFADVTVSGDREGLRALADFVSEGRSAELAFDPPSRPWDAAERPLTAIRVSPGGDRLCFRLETSRLVVSGPTNEIARILGKPISSLSEMPAEPSPGVAAHVHFDPASDHERRIYDPASIEVKVQLSQP